MMAVKLLFFVLLTGFALQVPSKSSAQNQASINLKKLIRLESKPIRFDSLVSTISKQAKVQFSFNTGKITPEKTFVMKPGEQTLEDVLVQIKSKTGIYYKIVGSHIILLDKRPEAGPVAQSKTPSNPAITRPKAPAKKTPAEQAAKKEASNPAGGSNNTKPVEPSPIIDIEVSGSTVPAADYLPVDPEKKDTVTGKPVPINPVKGNVNPGNVPHTDSLKPGPPGTRDSSKITDEGKPATNNISPSGVNPGSQGKKNKINNPTEDKDLRLFGGSEISRSTDIKDEVNANLMGWGVNIKIEKRITRNFSATASFGIIHFSGRYISLFNPFRSNGEDTIKNFTLTPLLGGIRYRLGAVVYLSAEAGLTFKNKANDRLLVILAPSAGVLLPVKGNKKVDLGLKFSHTVARPSLLGDPIPESGGYSFLSFRLAYGF